MYLWRFMWLHSHDYSAETGQFTYIIFFPIDVFARAKAFAKTFDGVQLEIDYFFLKPVLATWVVGHVGVSCFKHIYWLLAIQIAISECEKTATPLLQAAVDVIDDHTEAHVTNVLADGGKALSCAIKNVSRQRSSRSDVAQFTLEVGNIYFRRCFSHGFRFGGTRGGGKRGGKGSLPRYLLDQKVPPKVMGKMMGTIILFNYLPGAVIF